MNLPARSRPPVRLNPGRLALSVALLLAALVPSGARADARLPVDGQIERLVSVVNGFSARLGVKRDATEAILESRVSPTLAGRFADTLRTLRRCDRLSRAAFPEVRAVITKGGFQATHGTRQALERADQIRECGQTVGSRLDAVAQRIGARVPSSEASPVDLWPVLRYEPGEVDNEYVHDYVLLIDEGGNDGYFNNAGGNGFDPMHGPAGSGAPIEADAVGCRSAFAILDPRNCVVTSAALLDPEGNDSYGRLEPPDPEVDGICTGDPLQRRLLVQGAGVAGVGVLIDEQGHDSYTGKVLTTGSGHLGGFGYLRDEQGDDSYSVIRIAGGAATVTGEGALRDLGGDDEFDFYLPSPLDPEAPNFTPGAGGIRDDLNNCDREVFQTFGSGNLGGIGRFENVGGDDSYHAPPRSLGFGSLGGVGEFTDSGRGADSYAGAGAEGRGNGITLMPTLESQGFFEDDG